MSLVFLQNSQATTAIDIHRRFGGVFFGNFPAVIAADAKAIAFGNFKRGYTIVDRIGTRILRDPYTNKPFVGFYTTKRTGGMLVDSQAIKLLKIAAA